MRGLVLALALPVVGCVHTPQPSASAPVCDSPSIGERSECMLTRAQGLQTQLEQEEAALLSELQAADARATAETGTGRSLAQEFERSRDAWREYRDAECSLAYATAFGGAIRGLKAATCLGELNEERLGRVRALRAMLSEASPTQENATP